MGTFQKVLLEIYKAMSNYIALHLYLTLRSLSPAHLPPKLANGSFMLVNGFLDCQAEFERQDMYTVKSIYMAYIVCKWKLDVV